MDAYQDDLNRADWLLTRIATLRADTGAVQAELSAAQEHIRLMALLGPARAANRSRRRWRAIEWTGRAAVVAGLVLIGAVAYQNWTGDRSHTAQQKRLRAEFAQVLERDGRGRDAIAVATPQRAIPAPLPTDALARIEMPSIGVDEIVVDGIGRAELQRGPGHYPTTSLPGHAGNSALAGHRTTHGAPFGDVDDLATGDAVVVTTLEGRFTYRVADQRVVDRHEMSVLADQGDNRLTLTTCHPENSSRQRLVVVAILAGDPVAST